MAVATVTGFQVRPGRGQEFWALVAEAKKIHEGLGGKVRVWTATAAGPNTGNVSYVIEYPDLTAFASFQAKLQADKAWQAFQAKAFSDNPTSKVLGMSLVSEPAL